MKVPCKFTLTGETVSKYTVWTTIQDWEILTTAISKSAKSNSALFLSKVIISCRTHWTSAWQHKHLSTRAFRHIAKSSQLQDALDVGLATLYLKSVFKKILFWKKIEKPNEIKFWTIVWICYTWSKCNMENTILFLILPKYNSKQIQ